MFTLTSPTPAPAPAKLFALAGLRSVGKSGMPLVSGTRNREFKSLLSDQKSKAKSCAKRNAETVNGTVIANVETNAADTGIRTT